jgi:uncharacterized membrane protein YtjA (UPF0391 family)
MTPSGFTVPSVTGMADEKSTFERGVASQGKRRSTMLNWALIFLVVALLAAALGFGGIAGAAAGFAKILFFLFLILFLVSLLMGRRGSV